MAEPKYKQQIREAEARASEYQMLLHLALNVAPTFQASVWDTSARYNEPKDRYSVKVWQRRGMDYATVTHHTSTSVLVWMAGGAEDCARHADVCTLYKVASTICEGMRREVAS